MKIAIKAGATHMTLRIPNMLLLSKRFWRSISQSGKFPSRIRLYKAVRRYIRKNGHFTLVEVTGSDGESVKITI